FIVVSLIDLVSILAGMRGPEMIAKPLIVLSLVGYYVTRAKRVSKLFVAALLCCCTGDAILLFEQKGESILLYGLFAFLAGHLFYIASFAAHRFSAPATGAGIQRLRLAFPVVLTGTGLAVMIYPSLGP